MGHKKLSPIDLSILLAVGVLSVFYSTAVASGAPSVGPGTLPRLPAPEANSQAAPVDAQQVSVWEQVNANGFSDPQTVEVTALESFNGYLYAGTHNPIDPAPLYDGAQIFRSLDGMTWTPVTQPGFGNSHDIAPPAILDFVLFNNRLYAGTGRGNASQIWRTSNGTIWAPMDVTGFSDPDNVDITALAVYDGMIYAGVRNNVTGVEIWRSFTGDNNSWTQIVPLTPGTSPASVTGFTVFGFDGGLYAAIESEAAPAQIWRSYGSDWEILVDDGFGDANTLSTGGIAEFGGYLYVGAGNTATGAQLWRTNDGVAWEQAITPGFGDPNNQGVETVFVFQNQLYAGLQNAVTGIELWRSADGLFWQQVEQDGFGNSNNSTTNGSNATAEFVGQLYIGTSNHVDGGEIYNIISATDTVGVFRPTNGIIFLKNSHSSGFADVALNYGIPGDYPVTGDWDGNGTDTIGVYRNGTFFLRNSNTVGFADVVFAFGQPGDQPIAGDWDGDGDDTIGIFRPSIGLFLLCNSNSAGPADASFFLGNMGDVGIAGDWDGDGDDTTGVFRPSNGALYLKNTNATGFADIQINYGLPGDMPVTGDWDGDGDDTIGVYRNGVFMLRNSNTIGFADIVFGLGNPGDMPIAGDWNGLP